MRREKVQGDKIKVYKILKTVDKVNTELFFTKSVLPGLERIQ